MLKTLFIRGVICIQLMVKVVTSFGILTRDHRQWQTRHWRRLQNTQLHVDNQSKDDAGGDNDGGSSYQSSASFTKGIVSSLTSLTNSIFQTTAQDTTSSKTINTSSSAPTSPQELQSRIRNEYTQNNYLWTGNLDTSSFVSNCTFTDPTLSFVGVDKFVENVGNLVPVVNYLLGDEQRSRSELLDITLNEEKEYIQTRWNMVGELNKLPWKPKIDVIGNTKFWYQEMEQEKNGGGAREDSAFQVYFYDEMWEIPAGLALLQLVTKAGTIANTGEKN